VQTSLGLLRGSHRRGRTGERVIIGLSELIQITSLERDYVMICSPFQVRTFGEFSISSTECISLWPSNIDDWTKFHLISSTRRHPIRTVSTYNSAQERTESNATRNQKRGPSTLAAKTRRRALRHSSRRCGLLVCISGFQHVVKYYTLLFIT